MSNTTTEYLNNKVFESVIEKFQRSQREKAKYELIMEDIDGSEKRTKKKKDRHDSRQNKEAFEKANTEFFESKTELAYAFLTLSENIVRYAKFSLIDQDDAIQEGVMICFEKVDRFDPNYKGKNGQKAKAFNYLTTCILNHFRQLYRTARNYNELKKRYGDFLSSHFEDQVCRNMRERPRSYTSSLHSS